jgi:hypothetical protein
MALQLNFTNAHNQTFPNAYAIVHEFLHENNILRVEVLFYENQSSYQNGNAPIERLNFVYSSTDGMEVSDIYNQLKQEDIFIGSIDI